MFVKAELKCEMGLHSRFEPPQKCSTVSGDPLDTGVSFGRATTQFPDLKLYFHLNFLVSLIFYEYFFLFFQCLTF